MEGLAQPDKRKEIVNRVVPLGAIVAHPRNYQQHPESQIAELMASLRRFGQVRSLVVQEQDGGYLMVAGHGVMEAARRLEWKELRADVLPATWTAEQVMAYLVADNELAKQAEPDEVQLATLLKELEAAEFGLEGLGWDEDELEALIDELGMGEETPVDPGPQLDKAEELRERWGVCTGQVWEMGEHRLVCGDCTDRTVVEAVTGGKRVELMLTSPPYWVGKEYEKEVTWEAFLNLLEAAFLTLNDYCQLGAYAFINFSENTDKPMVMGEVYRHLFCDHLGWIWHSERYWKRPAGQPIYVWNSPRPRSEGESIWTFRKGRGDEKVRNFNISSQKFWETGPHEHIQGHPSVMHCEIAERAIEIYTDLKSVVFDPFVGSGTTIIACERLGRRCRAIEIDPGYCAVAIQRWVDMTGGEPHLVEE